MLLSVVRTFQIKRSELKTYATKYFPCWKFALCMDYLFKKQKGHNLIYGIVLR